MDGLNILYCSYRQWSDRLLTYVKYFLKEEHYTEFSLLNFSHISTTKELKEKDLNDYDLIFFVGWSEIIPKDIVNNNKCICLHPSPLPKYRGGSPIQHQIINGETESLVSLFLMDEGIDTGSIIHQIPFSLKGNLNDIFSNICNVSYLSIAFIILEFWKFGKINLIPQDNSKSTFFKRRTPEMSEIKIEDFENYTVKELHNKVRALQDPYPNAFIRCKNGEKLYLKVTSY
jgi:methionyl-tRNA formyltransferase|tara:strand:+ start:4943 stop:5632 length:690 start_codon:yes stop_codon:yes gene_type:complete